jgi:hypothetical protein
MAEPQGPYYWIYSSDFGLSGVTETFASSDIDGEETALALVVAKLDAYDSEDGLDSWATDGLDEASLSDDTISILWLTASGRGHHNIDWLGIEPRSWLRRVAEGARYEAIGERFGWGGQPVQVEVEELVRSGEEHSPW